MIYISSLSDVLNTCDFFYDNIKGDVICITGFTYNRFDLEKRKYDNPVYVTHPVTVKSRIFRDDDIHSANDLCDVLEECLNKIIFEKL